MNLLLSDQLEPDQLGLRRDAARLFTRRGVYLLGALVRLGMSPAQGIPQAMKVCDLGLTGRTETCRFPEGETFLVVVGDGRCAVLNFTDETMGGELLQLVLPGAASDAIILIDVS